MEVEALPRVPVLGAQGTWVEGEGDWAGMGKGGVKEAGLLGLIAVLPDRVLFVKMVGPAATIRAERSRFDAFCRSLESVQ